MRTNIEIDDELMRQAMAVSSGTTKKAVVEEALRKMIALQLQGDAIERLWESATWCGPDEDWFGTDPLSAAHPERGLEGPDSANSDAGEKPAGGKEPVGTHGHR